MLVPSLWQACGVMCRVKWQPMKLGRLPVYSWMMKLLYQGMWLDVPFSEEMGLLKEEWPSSERLPWQERR